MPTLTNLPRTILASAAERVVTASYYKLMHRVLGPYKILTVRDNTSTAPEALFDNTISIHGARKASDRRKNYSTNDNSRHVEEEPLLAQLSETNIKAKKQIVGDKIVRHVTQNGDTKYFV